MRVARFLRRFLSTQRPVARGFLCAVPRQPASKHAVARSNLGTALSSEYDGGPGRDSRCGARDHGDLRRGPGRVLICNSTVINGCLNYLSRPMRSPGTICTPNIALIALDPCNSVTIVYAIH